MKGLNFSVSRPHSNLDMACSVESVVSKLPQTKGMGVFSLLFRKNPDDGQSPKTQYLCRTTFKCVVLGCNRSVAYSLLCYYSARKVSL
jgi:hypothetical protein